ncbi:MAG: DUF1573 domain-containing protein [Opitutales bacterium]
MLSRLRSLAAALAALTATIAASAALHWTAREVVCPVPIGAARVEAVFTFTNPGPQPVTILSIKPDCGCTTATLAKSTFAAGESGEIRVAFNFGDRIGPQEKRLWVTTDDAPGNPVELKLTADIPPVLTVEPRLVWWKIGEAAQAKTVTLALHPNAGLTLDDVVAENAHVTFRLVIAAPGTYRLILQPVGTTQPAQTRLWVKVSVPGQAARTFTVFARVQ